MASQALVKKIHFYKLFFFQEIKNFVYEHFIGAENAYIILYNILIFWFVHIEFLTDLPPNWNINFCNEFADTIF